MEHLNFIGVTTNSIFYFNKMSSSLLWSKNHSWNSDFSCSVEWSLLQSLVYSFFECLRLLNILRLSTGRYFKWMTSFFLVQAEVVQWDNKVDLLIPMDILLPTN